MGARTPKIVPVGSLTVKAGLFDGQALMCIAQCAAARRLRTGSLESRPDTSSSRGRRSMDGGTRDSISGACVPLWRRPPLLATMIGLRETQAPCTPHLDLATRAARASRDHILIHTHPQRADETSVGVTLSITISAAARSGILHVDVIARQRATEGRRLLRGVGRGHAARPPVPFA